MKKYHISVLIIIIFMISADKETVIRPDQMKNELYYEGFYILKPANSNWYLYASESKDYEVTIREISKISTYTIFFKASYNSIPEEPVNIEDFERIILNCGFVIKNKERFEMLEVKTEKVVRQNQWCINYYSKIRDNNPANSNAPLVMYDRGFFCLHPAEKKSIVKGVISQRGLEKDLKLDLDDDMKYLLEGIKLTNPDGSLLK